MSSLLIDESTIRLKRHALRYLLPTLVGLLSLVVLLSYKQGLMTTKDRLYFFVASAGGLTTGMPVKLNGFVVGNVDNILLLPPSAQSDQRVRIELGIFRDYMGYIPKATKARLSQELLIGQSAIELLPLRYDARPVTSGEVLIFERSKGLNEIAQDIQARLEPVLANTQQFTQSLNNPDAAFQQTLKASSSLLAALPKTNQDMQATLQQSRDSLRNIEQQSTQTLKTADHALNQIDQALPSLVSKVDRVVSNTEQVTHDLKQITGPSAKVVPEILSDVQTTAADSRTIVQGAKSSWPISALVGSGNANQPLPSDSLDGLSLSRTK